jgi:hypothetical protein
MNSANHAYDNQSGVIDDTATLALFDFFSVLRGMRTGMGRHACRGPLGKGEKPVKYAKGRSGRPKFSNPSDCSFLGHSGKHRVVGDVSVKK